MQKAYRGMGMEGSIARWYDKTTRRDMPEYQRYAQQFDRMLPAGSDILEVAPGPGFLSIELAKRGRHRITGLDISKTFVEIARKNAGAVGVSVDFQQGNASKIPFADSSFDFIACRAAFKNFSEPVRALTEMHRVLRPGGKGVIIDLRRDASMTMISTYVDKMGMSVLNGLFTKFIFRFMLIRRAYTVPQFKDMLARVPFSRTWIEANEVGLEAWFEK
ncbi:MAG TPA: methyltransferase domain-containing protein [Silvibacterium sp.]|nr:methyltransferase domain-containing protein [Silvibacterium sp.]